jgi:Domain of unknown function (DUF4166)
MSTTPSLYRRVLGDAFDVLPAPVKALHDLPVSTEFSGTAEVIAAHNVIARIIAWTTGFPTRSYHCKVRVRIDIDDDGETWRRDFDGHRFQSRLRCRDGVLVEQLGPHRISFRLHTDNTELSMHPIAWKTLGIPLPRLFWPSISAREAEVDGCFHFDVATAFPIIGTVIHYRGSLLPTQPAPSDLRNL